MKLKTIRKSRIHYSFEGKTKVCHKTILEIIDDIIEHSPYQEKKNKTNTEQLKYQNNKKLSVLKPTIFGLQILLDKQDLQVIKPVLSLICSPEADASHEAGMKLYP